jgi:hypothetical protein
VRRSLLFAAWLLERAPFARWHRLHGVGADLYYVAKYGKGRHAGGRWFYRA